MPKHPEAAKGEMGILVGYEPHGLGYGVHILGTAKVIVTPHVRFPNVPFFPCQASLIREVGAESLFDSDVFAERELVEVEPTLPPFGEPEERAAAGPRTSMRERTLSAAAIRNIADRDVAPDYVNWAKEMADIDLAFFTAHDFIYASTSAGQSTVDLLGALIRSHTWRRCLKKSSLILRTRR